jgi:hypothetical protein
VSISSQVVLPQTVPVGWWLAYSYLRVADLIELRKLRKSREGIDVTKLGKGDIKKKKKKKTKEEEEEEQEERGGLRPVASGSHDVEE